MKSYSILCRGMRQPLEAGLTLLQVAKLLAKGGPRGQRRLGAHLAARVQGGQALGDALASFRPSLPALFLSMARVGEETGRLPDTLRGLERYYALQEKMLRQVRGRFALLLIQFGLAVLVLALVIGITTTVAPRGGIAILGLRGWGGALAFVGLAGAVLVLLYLLVRLLAWSVRHSRGMASIARRLPGLGPFWEALLLSRLALALHLTMDSSLPLPRALRLSFRATGDAAYEDAGEGAAEGVRRGKELSVALGKARLLPLTFLEVVAVAEAVGSVPERLGHLAEEYHEEAVRRSQGLVRWASLLLWFLYAVPVLLAIFALAGAYRSALGP